MSDSFSDNPAISFSIGREGNFEGRKQSLAIFLYDYCKRRKGVYLSNNKKGIICFYHSDTSVNPFMELLSEIKLVLSAIGLRRLQSTWLRSHLIRKHQKAYQPFIHCWYIGIEREHRGHRTAYELMQLLLNESTRTRRPILAETMIEQNKRVYERMGFIEYGRVQIGKTTTYLLIRHAQSEESPGNDA